MVGGFDEDLYGHAQTVEERMDLIFAQTYAALQTVHPSDVCDVANFALLEEGGVSGLHTLLTTRTPAWHRELYRLFAKALFVGYNRW